jgi:Arc/MetJ-type ribon-helix-helix transcriptional regulator
MKIKTSVALDEETLVKISELVRSGSFRNKSHVMEYAIIKLVGGERNERI